MENRSLPVIPLLNKTRLDIPSGSWVRIETKREGILEGQIFENPIVTSRNQNQFSVQIINVTSITTGQTLPGMLTLYESEIDTVVLKGKADLTPEQASKGFKIMKNYVEFFMNTIVISSMYQLHNLYKYMTDEGITEVGCSFETSEEMGGEVLWVLLTMSNTIMPINVTEISKQSKVKGEGDHLWISLGENLFSNENITKIFLDCDYPAKYLYSVHEIHLKNVFDIRIAELYTTNEKDSIDLLKPSLNHKSSQSLQLSAFLSKYLPHRVHPKEFELLSQQTFDSRNLVNEDADDDSFKRSKSKLFEDVDEDILMSPFDKANSCDISKRENLLLKVMAIKVKFLTFLKAEMEKKMFHRLETLFNYQMDFIVRANNATSYAFLSAPSLVGDAFKHFLKNLCAEEQKVLQTSAKCSKDADV